jgi:FkbM family methyltransferase
MITRRMYYLPAMLLVRFSRKLKSIKVSSKREFIVIPNFMGSIRMMVDKNSYMGGSIYWCGFHHINELLFLRKYLKSDMVFVDVGANQGEFALFAASQLTNGQVYAFEPTSYQLGLLKKNQSLNNFHNLKIINYGLYHEVSKMDVYTSFDTSLHSGLHEGLSTLYKSEFRSQVEETINLKVFDHEFLEELTRLDVVKIDVEGAEFYVLQGMKHSLENFKPLLIIEMNEETFNEAGYEISDVLNFLSPMGYQAYRLFRGKIFPIVQFDKFSNVVFICNHHKPE